MSDITCSKCGEPWDSYGITYCRGKGDMMFGEAEQFLRGEGCPSCDFGTSCTECNGTGKMIGSFGYDPCRVCKGSRYVIARKTVKLKEGCVATDPFGTWVTGYAPSVTTLPADMRLLKAYRGRKEYLNCFTEEAKVLCPFCPDEIPPCAKCGGTGKFVAVGDRFMEFLESAVDASDDPDEILLRFAA